MHQLSHIKDKAKTKLISIIVPIYNVEHYLEQCLDSLVGQTLKNIEIIAVNDGSTDNSSEILDRYAKQYPQIKAFHKANGGLSDARNFGIEKSTGEYIGFVDSDDWVDRDMFKEMYNKAQETNSDIVACGGMKHYENKDGLEIERTSPLKLRGNLLDCGYSAREKPNLLFITHSYAWNKIFKNSLFIDKKNRFPTGQWFEDSALIYNLLLQANHIACIPKYFYNYRVGRDGAITNSVSPKIFDIFKSCDAMTQFYNKNIEKNHNMNIIFEKLILGHILVRFDTLFNKTNNDKLLAWKYIKDSWVYLDKHFPGWRNRYKYAKNKKVPYPWKARKSKSLAFMYIFTPNWIKSPVQLGIQSVIKLKKQKRLRKKEQNTLMKRRKIQENGFLVLDDLQKIFNSLSIMYFVDFGTLLGFIRDGDFMSHDLDIDIGVICNEKQKIDIRIMLEKHGYKIWRTYLMNDSKIVEQSYLYLNKKKEQVLKFDINFYESEGMHSKTWLFYSDPIYQLKPTYRNIVEMKYSKIKEVSFINIKGYNIPIPKNAKQLLKEKYGPTWEIPDPEWIYWKSPAATTLRQQGRFVGKHMMPSTELYKIWSTHLTILDKFKNICLQNNLNYQIVENSLLGAIKQDNMYTTWNGDIDIFMTKDDYKYFISIDNDNILNNSMTLTHTSESNKLLSFIEIPNLNVLDSNTIPLYYSRIVIFLFDDLLPNKIHNNLETNRIRLLRINEMINVKEFNLLLSMVYMTP